MPGAQIRGNFPLLDRDQSVHSPLDFDPVTRGNQEPRIEDRWHRDPKKGEVVPFPADSAGAGSYGTWCMDRSHGAPGTRVCKLKHSTGRRWMVCWKFNGTAHSESFHRKSEAEHRKAQITSELFTGSYVDSKRSSELFGTFAETWFADVKVKKLKPSSRAGERSKLDNTVLPRWRDVPLSEIEHEAVQQWVTWMVTNPDSRQPRTTNPKRAGERKPLSAATAVKAYQVFNQVLAYAVRTKRLAHNPADGVELPKIDHPGETALEHWQVAALVAAAGEAGPIFLTLAYSAMRFGELAALRVRDVNVEKRVIHVRKGVVQVTGQKELVEDTPKTRHSVRDVPILTSELVEVLQRQIEGRQPDEFLFPGPDGGAMRNSWLRWRFDQACKTAGLSDVRIKTLRHTGGSLALDVPGTVITTVSNMMGHKKVSTTMNVYAHQLENAFAQLAEGMDAAARAATRPDTQ